ncbi:hypothetical protein PV327_006118 [Microctonus hyperodae]|uniref:Nicotinamide riboside kinase 1 n=1 Tax=Microctonus hyperodae TaxID=165561 RepID=A0AA39G3L6_MICHY|nr:hypothetical protein PV327_006118 [Microctonus hyperodae]
MARWLIIGISGVTCSGKTTLAKKLHESLRNSSYINQDCYYLPPDDSRHTHIAELNHHNWDIITSIDMEKMYLDVLKILESSDEKKNEFSKKESSVIHILIIDGILIFNYKQIADMCHLKYFLTLTKQQTWERRQIRLYDPPDVPGYFDKIVWPEYLKYKEKIDKNQKMNETIIFIDGGSSMVDVFQKVFNDVSMKLQNFELSLNSEYESSRI